MIDCPYYRVDTLRFRSREIRSDQQVANVKTIRSLGARIRIRP